MAGGARYYERGAQLERNVKRQLEGLGYFVMRSAGSKGPCDLIAINDESIRLIQIKQSSERSMKSDVEKAIAALRPIPFPLDAPVTKEVWVYCNLQWEKVVVEG